MPSTPTRRSAAERVAQIAGAARSIALESGLGAVTLRAVAGAVGVAPALVAHYAPSMDELVADTFSRVVGDELAEVIALADGCDSAADALSAVLASLPVGHGGTFSRPMGGAVAHVAVDWLEWQLKGDRVAARTFVGENCRLCTGTDWTIERKGF